MDFDFWRGKRVLVTGHTGFKGSWLSLWLQHLGARVTGYALDPPTDTNLFEVARVAEGMQDIRGDVRDLTSVQQAFDAYAPEIVFHLAAQPLVRLSYEVPVETYETNIMGTVNILEACRHCPAVRSIVSVTSDKCYENQEWPWGYRECDPMGGADPYSSSKGCAELVVSAYRQSFLAERNAGVASARAGNVIGGGDWAKDRLIPDIVRGLVRQGGFLIRNPSAVRPWQHVLEPLRGYLMLAERLYDDPQTWSSGWNFGPTQQDAQPVSVIADWMIELWNSGTWTSGQSGNAVHEANLLQLDCSKASRLLHWNPVFSLNDALRYSVSWYRSFYAETWDLKAVSLDQIDQYLTACKRSTVLERKPTRIRNAA